MGDKIIEIDSLNIRPHTRHRAIVNKVRKPYEDDRILDSSIAMTLCGRAIGWFTETRGTGLLLTDGSTYATQCKGCYGEPVIIDMKNMSAEQRDRYTRSELGRRFEASRRLRETIPADSAKNSDHPAPGPASKTEVQK